MGGLDPVRTSGYGRAVFAPDARKVHRTRIKNLQNVLAQIEQTFTSTGWLRLLISSEMSVCMSIWLRPMIWTMPISRVVD